MNWTSLFTPYGCCFIQRWGECKRKMPIYCLFIISLHVVFLFPHIKFKLQAHNSSFLLPWCCRFSSSAVTLSEYFTIFSHWQKNIGIQELLMSWKSLVPLLFWGRTGSKSLTLTVCNVQAWQIMVLTCSEKSKQLKWILKGTDFHTEGQI